MLAAIDDSLYELGMEAIARLEQKMKTASFNELIGIMDVALNRGDASRLAQITKGIANGT